MAKGDVKLDIHGRNRRCRPRKKMGCHLPVLR